MQALRAPARPGRLPPPGAPIARGPGRPVLDRPPARTYPIEMIRSRQRAGLLVLALMLLGIAASAEAALASGDCCAGMPASHGSSDPAAPCHSVAPTSCCEPGTTGRIPMPQGAPLLAVCAEAFAPAADPFRCHGGDSTPARERQAALASVVLRL
jgi:hypothetical protein